MTYERSVWNVRKDVSPKHERLTEILADGESKTLEFKRTTGELREAMVKWLPPHGFTGKVHHIKAEVGGTYKMSFTNLTTGHSHSFGGEFLEFVPNERIRHTDKFDDPNLAGQMQTTISLKKVSIGTELTVVQEGIPSAIPVEACYLGWQESLTLLTQLVEPEIKE